jgi:hypothetical protein
VRRPRRRHVIAFLRLFLNFIVQPGQFSGEFPVS